MWARLVTALPTRARALSAGGAPVMKATSLNSLLCLSSGVTSFVTVFPPSFVRSFAIPQSICAIVTYTTASAFVRLAAQSWSKRNSIPIPASWIVSPARSVERIPHRSPMNPATRFVATPASSYSENISAVSQAEKPSCVRREQQRATAPIAFRQPTDSRGNDTTQNSVRAGDLERWWGVPGRRGGARSCGSRRPSSCIGGNRSTRRRTG